MQQFVGIDWATRRARWCAVTSTGVVIDEGWAPADEDGLAGLVMRLGPEASACMEMMSGAAWVRERLQAAGWTVQIADARKAKAVGSLAAKTDKLDARVPSWRAATWCRRCTCRRSPIANSRNASAAECTWSGCGQRRSTVPTAF